MQVKSQALIPRGIHKLGANLPAANRYSLLHDKQFVLLLFIEQVLQN